MIVLRQGPYAVLFKEGRTQPYTIWRDTPKTGCQTVFFCASFVEAQSFVSGKTA